MAFSCRQVQQTQRNLFMRFLLSLVADPVMLRTHANNNARIPWFHKRIKFKPSECSIISTTWLFSRYCDWKDSLGQFPVGSVEEACSSQYANPSGEQKSFTLFVRQNVLKKVGDSQRLKGQDTAEGNSEYFIVIPGGIETLDEALRTAPMPGKQPAIITRSSRVTESLLPSAPEALLAEQTSGWELLVSCSIHADIPVLTPAMSLQVRFLSAVRQHRPSLHVLPLSTQTGSM